VATSQQTPPQSQPAAQPPSQSAEKTPQIKLNFLNVCTPTEAEQKEIAAGLNKIPASVTYTGDFEVTRGRLITQKEAPSKYLRLRRELGGNTMFSNVQYSLSADDKVTTETLVFKTKDPKDLVLISIEDQISSTAVKPASVLDADTPATHIKLERFGKNAIALARCENDQSVYEPIFAEASKLIAQYRKALGLRTMFKNDLAWLSTPDEAKPKPAKPSAKTSKGSADETKTAGKHLN
jgi:hypothetical protein